MEIFSELQVLCEGNPPVIGGFSLVDSPHKGQWRGDLMFSLICAWTNGSANNQDAGDLSRHRAHYGVTATTPMVNMHCIFDWQLMCFDWNSSSLNDLRGRILAGTYIYIFFIYYLRISGKSHVLIRTTIWVVKWPIHLQKNVSQIRNCKFDRIPDVYRCTWGEEIWFCFSLIDWFFIWWLQRSIAYQTGLFNVHIRHTDLNS